MLFGMHDSARVRSNVIVFIDAVCGVRGGQPPLPTTVDEGNSERDQLLSLPSFISTDRHQQQFTVIESVQG